MFTETNLSTERSCQNTDVALAITVNITEQKFSCLLQNTKGLEKKVQGNRHGRTINKEASKIKNNEVRITHLHILTCVSASGQMLGSQDTNHRCTSHLKDGLHCVGLVNKLKLVTKWLVWK